MADITMPQLGETVTEGTITKWFKKVGDPVAEDEPLFEVSTDKVDSEVPSSATGTLAEILVQEGETVDVGVKLAVITAGGDGAAQAPSQAEAPTERPEDEPAPEGTESRPAAADAEAESAQEDESPSEPEPAPQPSPGNGQAAPAPAKPAEPAEPAANRLLSPVVRRLVNEHGLDPDQIPGTGQEGRITRADVLAFIDKNGGRAKAGQTAAQAEPTTKTEPQRQALRAAPAPAARVGADDEVIPFSNIRRRTAEHMIRSQATSAHVLVAAEVDYAGVDKVRKAEKDAFKAREGFSLTYLPFIARAVIDALADFPHVNASVGENELILHRRINLAIAVDLSFEGLIVPVVRDADQLRLGAIARKMADLAGRARSRDLTADDISGGTFTITNPGPFGTFLTFPVINQPQVAILATDGIRKRPVAVELPDGTDAIVVRPVGMLGLAFDHRAFDGAYASTFLAKVKEILETRDWSAEL